MRKINKEISTCGIKDEVNFLWSFKILILSFLLSVFFSFLSETVLTHTSMIFSIAIILIFMFIGVISDMCGVAITSCYSKFETVKNEKHQKMCKQLVKNSDKISVVCCDIIGDICSILSGACGASIIFKVVSYNNLDINVGILSTCVSGLIACLTIFFKSLEKTIAVKYSEKLTLTISKVLCRMK
jgi:CBS domain containing-hemolysin-like protein